MTNKICSVEKKVVPRESIDNQLSGNSDKTKYRQLLKKLGVLHANIPLHGDIFIFVDSGNRNSCPINIHRLI